MDIYVGALNAVRDKARTGLTPPMLAGIAATVAGVMLLLSG